MDLLLGLWNEIHALNNDASLSINPPYNIPNHLFNKNIELRTKGNKYDLINDLKSSKIMLIPGHKGEVFCLAAEEARELCIPIVTMGYGSLYERVEHNKTGYIAKNKYEFINYAHKLLNDDILYSKFKNNLFKLRNSRTYKDVATDLIKIINS